jgi:hypothetical protein
LWSRGECAAPVTVGCPSDVEGQGSDAVAGVGDLGRARLGAVQHAKEVDNFVVMVQQEIHPLRPLPEHADIRLTR